MSNQEEKVPHPKEALDAELDDDQLEALELEAANAVAEAQAVQVDQWAGNPAVQLLLAIINADD